MCWKYQRIPIANIFCHLCGWSMNFARVKKISSCARVFLIFCFFAFFFFFFSSGGGDLPSSQYKPLAKTTTTVAHTLFYLQDFLVGFWSFTTTDFSIRPFHSFFFSFIFFFVCMCVPSLHLGIIHFILFIYSLIFCSSFFLVWAMILSMYLFFTHLFSTY